MRPVATMNTCARCHNAVDADELRCAVCGLALPEPSNLALAATKAMAIRCDSCNAAVRYSAEVGATTCAFCGSRTHLEREEDRAEEAEALVPFMVSPYEAKNAMRRWLGTRGFFAPKDLAQEATLEHVRPLQWPAWICEAKALVSWTADSNQGAGRAAWAPHAGQRELGFQNLLIPASKGLTLDECRQLTPRFALDQATPGAELPDGTVVERFEATRSAARRIIVGALEREATERLTSGVIPGTRHRKVKAELLLRGLRSRRLTLPTHVLAYRYRNKLYRVLVHGQDASLVIGKSPVSFWRVALTVLGIAAGIAAIVAVVLLLTQR